MRVAVLVSPVDQAQLAGRLTEPVDDHAEDGLFEIESGWPGKRAQELVEAELFPELTNRQHRAVLADGVDANVTETDAVQALGRGQLAEVLDEAVDGLRGELVAAAEGTEAVLDDSSLEALTLDDVDVLIGAVAAPDAAGTDVHVGSTVSERASNVNRPKCCHYAF